MSTTKMRTVAPPSRREIEVIRAVATHGTIRAAAAALFLSPHTIDAHLDSLRHRSGLRYLPQLVAWAARNGWLTSSSPGGDPPEAPERQRS